MKKIFQAIILLILIPIIISVFKYIFIDHKLFTKIETPKPTITSSWIRFE